MSGIPNPNLSTDEMVRLYLAGETSPNIAKALGCSSNSVRARLRAAGVTIRKPGAAPARVIGYTGYHDRVRSIRGKPTLCEECGESDPSKRYEWASISENYADPYDYRRLCRPCHIAFDDMGARIIAGKIGKPRHDLRRFTPEIIAILKTRHLAGESFSALAREFGVHNSTINSLVQGKRSYVGEGQST